jgi:hypothetical protein
MGPARSWWPVIEAIAQSSLFTLKNDTAALAWRRRISKKELLLSRRWRCESERGPWGMRKLTGKSKGEDRLVGAYAVAACLMARLEPSYPERPAAK